MPNKKGTDRSTREQVDYRYAEDNGSLEGRVYGPNSLQTLNGWIRRILGYKYYHDLDFENCAPMIISQVCIKFLGHCPPILLEYAEKRDAVFEKCQSNLPTSELKKKILVLMHGGADCELEQCPSVLLRQFKSELAGIGERLSRVVDYAELFEEIKKDPNRPNKLGSFIAYVYQRTEHTMLMALSEFITQKKYRVGSLIFDGLLVERIPDARGIIQFESAFPLEQIKSEENYILAKTGFKICIKEKSLIPTKEDWQKFYGPKSVNKLNPWEKQIEALTREGYKDALIRSDGFTFKRHPTVPGVYVVGEEANVFINRVLGDKSFFIGAQMKDLTTWFEMNQTRNFPLLFASSFSTNIIAFRNCYLNIDTMLMHPHDEEEVKPTKHFFDVHLDEDTFTRETPLWDKLLSTQLKPRSLCMKCGISATMTDRVN